MEVDPEAARTKLGEASRHLSSAERVQGDDPEGAYALLYDASRKAIDAHMLANGYRVSKGRLGAHQATILYAEAVLGAEAHGGEVDALDRMRRTRNRSEYELWTIGEPTLARDLEHAKEIVRLVESAL
ncbi:MAG: hypothetical protein ACRDH8_08655 [Actinomycetota bacterium]